VIAVFISVSYLVKVFKKLDVFDDDDAVSYH